MIKSTSHLLPKKSTGRPNVRIDNAGLNNVPNKSPKASKSVVSLLSEKIVAKSRVGSEHEVSYRADISNYSTCLDKRSSFLKKKVANKDLVHTMPSQGLGLALPLKQTPVRT